jgi:hypothetical protein
MENQHRKITGYRELDQTEINLMNEVKNLGIQMDYVLLSVAQHLNKQETAVYTAQEAGKVTQRRGNATPERFLAMAKTEFQTGLMYATRAVAQPEFF